MLCRSENAVKLNRGHCARLHDKNDLYSNFATDKVDNTYWQKREIEILRKALIGLIY